MRLAPYLLTLVMATATVTAPAGASDWSALVSGNEVAGYSVEGATGIDVKQAQTMFENGVAFVDFRDQNAWAIGHIPGSVRCGTVTESNIMSIISKETPAVFYCEGRDCKAAADAAARAVDWGFKSVHYFADGYNAWVGAGHPVE